IAEDHIVLLVSIPPDACLASGDIQMLVPETNAVINTFSAVDLPGEPSIVVENPDRLCGRHCKHAGEAILGRVDRDSGVLSVGLRCDGVSSAAFQSAARVPLHSVLFGPSKRASQRRRCRSGSSALEVAD